MRAWIITIGDEVLIGQTVNTNAAWLGQQLSQIGVAIKRVVTIGDDAGLIQRSVREAMEHADLLLVTGGLGPTHDDVTKTAISELFESKLIFYPEILERMKKRFRELGYEMPASNEGQAWLPEKARILPNLVGSAQGMLFERDGHRCVVMPGVPREMRYIVEHSLIPMLSAEEFDEYVVHFTWRTTGIAESRLFELLGDISAIEAHGKLAFLPKYSGVDLRLSTTAKSKAEAKKHIQMAEKIILDKAGKYVYATGDVTLEAVIGTLLEAKKMTLAVAESCTGGLLGHKITSVPGSSNYFIGGFITYSNEEKISRLGVSQETLAREGAVSETTAREMAVGARERCKADFALAITGIAGPAGGSAEKPVGLVYIGLAGPRGVRVHRYLFGPDREINKERSAYAALHMLLRELKD